MIGQLAVILIPSGLDLVNGSQVIVWYNLDSGEVLDVGRFDQDEIGLRSGSSRLLVAKVYGV